MQNLMPLNIVHASSGDSGSFGSSGSTGVSVATCNNGARTAQTPLDDNNFII